MPPWLNRVQARLVYLICAGVFGFLAYLMTLRAERFAEYGDTTVYLKLSMAPVAWLMAALLLTALIHLLFVFVLPPRTPHAPRHPCRPRRRQSGRSRAVGFSPEPLMVVVMMMGIYLALDMVMGVWPFVMADIVRLGTLIAFTAISLVLPRPC